MMIDNSDVVSRFPTGQKAPAALITKKKDVNTRLLFMFNGIHWKQGACGRYTKTMQNRNHKSPNNLTI